MDNKEYLDKVVGSLVRGTSIDYENNEVYFPFSPHNLFIPNLTTSLIFSYRFGPRLHSLDPFSKYCRNQYGLTNNEIEYVWDKYKDIINEQ